MSSGRKHILKRPADIAMLIVFEARRQAKWMPDDRKKATEIINFDAAYDFAEKLISWTGEDGEL